MILTPGFILTLFLLFIISMPAVIFAQIDFHPDSLKRHIYFLGSDSLAGRAPGTIGCKRAADYLADQLDNLGLIPIGDDSTFYQSIPMHGSIPLQESVLRFYDDDKIHDFELGKDYLLYKAGAQTFLPQPVPLVFVGYGIIAPEFDHNDYQSIDVGGKIAVFFSGEPPSHDANYFNGENSTVYSLPESKHRLAISRGALGSILIPNLLNERKTWNDWQQEFTFEDITLAYSVTSQLSAVMSPGAAARLFRNARISLENLLLEKAQISSFSLAGEISFRGVFIEREFISNNVIGMLEGDDPDLKDTYLIISAHYDHLGIGPPIRGDSIYNGVMDNAAGVAAVLEIARAFSESPQKPKRSVIFLFLTGEEKGLLGSIYYTDHPIKPLYKTVANVNVDGLALFDNFQDIVGVGAELSSLGEMLATMCSSLDLSISPMPNEFAASESYLRSDQIAFAQAGIPSILIMEGSNYQHLTADEARQRQIEWLENYYHTPFDDLNQPMNFAAGIQHCRLLFEFCQYVANLEAKPEWKPGTPYINAQLQSIAEKR